VIVKPSYAHVPDPNAGGTCGECLHCLWDGAKSAPKKGKSLWCRKAVEIAGYAGRGHDIKATTQGCKYWEFAR
jgi:hypothetical protein